MGRERRHLTAQEAAETLGVTTATLYAYASRGQLRSEPAPGRPRERRYDREDIERLKQRKETRRDPAKAAARGLHWGSPVFDSALTFIHGGKLYYRGQDAVQLAQTASLEEVAELLWAAEPEERGRLFGARCPLPVTRLARLRAGAGDSFTLLQAALPLAATADLASHDLRPAAVRHTGARIRRLFAAVLAGPRSESPVHAAIQARWAPRNAAVGEVIRAALVLCADHELNVSAFAARCAASAGASPYHAVAAGMATLKGYKHGGASERIAALVAETASPGRSRQVIANRLRRGEHIPGFGHPLYPDGDPRAAFLLRLAEASGHRAEWRILRAIRDAGAELLEEQPNLDFGLVAVARTYRLPACAPLILFALGRTVGWIGHVIEQYALDELIRPRARYVGPLPEAVPASRSSE
ncbi:MAG TPA: citrate synthase family protein [Candidatus Acidoferrales bacterium]|nr:citrate synthase family protein [Candidatus Acidoferrales bacterium]